MEKSFAAVICEYNPFHFGHMEQLKKIKEKYGGVICVMSGNLVQRGEAAIADKYKRAEAAVRCGADIVLELPFPYSCLSARDFAAAGVRIAAGSGAKTLAFGCENSPGQLYRLFDCISGEGFYGEVKEYIKKNKNLSFPAAVEILAGQKIGAGYAEMIKKPNNILALEYISAIKSGGGKLGILPLKREPGFSSSSELRKRIRTDGIKGLLPEAGEAVFNALGAEKFPRTNEKLSPVIIGALRQAVPAAGIYGADAGLQKIIIREAAKTASLETLAAVCKNKIYTEARIKRAALAMVFNITSEAAWSAPEYTFLLAAGKNGRIFLRENKKNITINIISKPAHINSAPRGIKEKILKSAAVDSVLALSEPTRGCDDFYGNKPFIGNNADR